MNEQTGPAPDYPIGELGGRLRSVRRARNLTLADLAERSGVSRSMLSEIERGSVNPTIGVLWNLTFALGIELTELLSNASVAEGGSSVIEHVKSYSTPVMHSRDGTCELRILSPPRTLLPIEWYEMRFSPGGRFDTPAYPAGTYLHLTVFSGPLTLQVGGRTVPVETGDTVRFPGDQDIRIEAPAEVAAVAWLVVGLPESYEGRQRT
jgi:transcriptional regulator with XRE-family HTH domain